MKINEVGLNSNVKHLYNENKRVLIKRMFKLCGITLFFPSIHVSCNSCIIEFKTNYQCSSWARLSKINNL